MPRKNRSIPHQMQSFATNCQDKRQFKSEQEALSAAEYQMLIKPTLELGVYRCDFCRGWHLTRQITDRK